MAELNMTRELAIERSNEFIAQILRRINVIRHFMGWPLRPVPWHKESQKLADELNEFLVKAREAKAITDEEMQNNYPVLDQAVNCARSINWKREVVRRFCEYFGKRMESLRS